MKSSDSFKLSSAWWKKEKPPALLRSGLGEALTAYEAAKAKISDKPSSLQTAKVALAAVETARKKAISNCGGLFPDAKVVLGKGDAVIKAAAADLPTLYKVAVKATLEPAKKDIIRRTDLCKGAVDVAQKVMAAVPKAGKRAGKAAGDATQTAMLKLAKPVAKAETMLRGAVTNLGEELNNYSRALILQAAKDGDQPEFMAAVTKAKAQYDSARESSTELGETLDDWEAELKKVDPKAEIERMYN